jgi:Tol biopolymer transport system component
VRCDRSAPGLPSEEWHIFAALCSNMALSGSRCSKRLFRFFILTSVARYSSATKSFMFNQSSILFQRLLLILFAVSLTSFAPRGAAAAPPLDRLAYFAAVDGVSDIYLMATDGTGLQNITRSRILGLAAFSWAPDGTQMVVAADRGSNLYIISVDGNTLRPLTHNTGFAITQVPAWSPDGSRIAYIGNAAANYDLFLIDPVTAAITRLTTNNGIYRDLAWSPDGTLLAYSSGPDFFHTYIYVMELSTGKTAQVTSGAGSHSAPAWSPNGRTIAYQNDFEFGPSEIFTVEVSGTNPKRLTSNFAVDMTPSWSPDGSKIAFATSRDSNVSGPTRYAVYTMNPDGSGLTRVTDLSISVAKPAWQPHPAPAIIPGVPVLMTEQGTEWAAAVDSVTLVHGPFAPLAAHNLSSDRRTRILLFLTNTDFAAVKTVTVQFTDAQGSQVIIPSENTSLVPGQPQIVQLTVRLPDNIAPGDASLSVEVNGFRTNTAYLKLRG